MNNKKNEQIDQRTAIIIINDLLDFIWNENAEEYSDALMLKEYIVNQTTSPDIGF